MDRYFVLLGGGELKTKETLALDRAIGDLAKARAGEGTRAISYLKGIRDML